MGNSKQDRTCMRPRERARNIISYTGTNRKASKVLPNNIIIRQM